MAPSSCKEPESWALGECADPSHTATYLGEHQAAVLEEGVMGDQVCSDYRAEQGIPEAVTVPLVDCEPFLTKPKSFICWKCSLKVILNGLRFVL